MCFLVDDVNDTGATLELTVQHLKQFSRQCQSSIDPGKHIRLHHFRSDNTDLSGRKSQKSDSLKLDLSPLSVPAKL